MTLEQYNHEKLDALSLRLVDLASIFRRMSVDCRENDLDGFALHDKKALEWLIKLDDWARECEGRLQTQLVKQKAQMRAAGGRPKR
jgi:hypothetical protein